MRCEEIMKSDVECVSPQDNVQWAAQKMRDRNIGFLPVCDSDKKVLGTITDRDLAVRIVADGSAMTTPIDNIMSRGVIACRPQDELQRAADQMAENHKSRIVCVDDDGRLKGVISLSDIAQRIEGDSASRTLRDVSQREARP